MSSGKKSNKGGNSKQSTRPSRPYSPKGDEEALGYHVFDYGKLNNQNQYNKTLEAIISYIG